MKKLLYILLLITLSFSNIFCQISEIDSLKQILKTVKHDTVKLRLYSEMINSENDEEVWTLYNEEMKYTAEKLLSTHPKAPVVKTAKKYLAESFNNKGIIFNNKGDINRALEFFSKSLKIEEEIGNKVGIASALNNIGFIYHSQGDIPMTLEFFTKSLRIEEEIGNKEGIASSLNNIGMIYNHQGDVTQAIEYLNKGLKIREQIGDKLGLATSLNNLGTVYKKQGESLKVLKCFSRSLEIQEEIGNRKGIAMCLNNIGFIYLDNGDVNKAMEFFRKSLKIQEEIGDKKGITHSMNNLGNAYLAINQPMKAKIYFEKSYQLSKELGFPENIEVVANGLKKVNEKLGNYHLAYKYYKEEVLMRDSMQNEANYKANIQQRAKYEYEKKAATDSIANAKEKEIKDAKIAKQQAQIRVKRLQQYGLLSGLVLVVFFAGFVFNRLKVTQRQKVIIEEQKQEVEHQKELVEEKHKEITDSINYAERIQRSFLATTEILDNHLKEYFVFFQPKDVVSGDFYWARELNNGNFAFSCADSTGHGVPGAIMSILNISSLEKSIEKYSEPDAILNETRKIIIERLKKDGSKEGGKDGMDCSLLVINSERTELSFAAANNPVFIVRNNELLEFKPDKMPVGKHDKDIESFTSHSIMLKKGDVIYTLTDGFPDQFGGSKGKKYMIKNLKEYLLQISELSMLEQKQRLTNEFNVWKGESEQVDDVCIIGVRI